MKDEILGRVRIALGPMSLPHYKTIIVPPSRWPSLELAELWRYRDLLGVLVWRDISTRYRQSIAGYGWAIVQPVVTMLIFTGVFGKMAKLDSEGLPYAIFNFTALLPWFYFSSCLHRATYSVVGGSSLITKVYFPRLILPLSSVLFPLVELAIQFAVLFMLMLWYRITPTWGILFLPLFIFLCILTALAIGLWLTALNVKYRDVGQLVPFAAQVWMWLTPVVYSSSMVPPAWRVLYGLNPLVGVIEGFRWALLGKAAPDWSMMAASSAAILMLFVGGLYYFRRVEQTFADLI